MKVICTMFRTNGKYYTEGSYEEPDQKALYQIWDDVAQRMLTGTLPGLIQGHPDQYIVLVKVPDHPHDHPHLIVPNSHRRDVGAVQGDAPPTPATSLEKWMTAISMAQWRLNYYQFCEKAGFRLDRSEDKWRAFQALVAALNQFDPRILEKICS
jgi:hypothetical protein